MRFSNNKFRGFSLAETLITLGIIGIVAALTIPNLITEHSKRRTVTQLKKAYAEISQALKLAEAEYGTPDGWISNNSDTFEEGSLDFINTYLEPNIKMAQKCTTDNSKCWGDKYKTLAGDLDTNANSHAANYLSFVSLSGYSVKLWAGGAATTSAYNRHYQFFIDVNGKKSPNIIGKDTFQFTYVPLQNGGWFLIPAGLYGEDYCFKDGGGIAQKLTREDFLSDPKYGCSKEVKGRQGSLLCTALIINDGWKISKDYPW